MKKLLAVVMSLVMLFTLAVMPVSAAQEEAKDEITVVEVIETIELTVKLIKDTIIQVHFIVGTVLGILETECPMCGEIHDVDLDEIVDGEEIVEEEEVVPEFPEIGNNEGTIIF